jgi:hypothetical protein
MDWLGEREASGVFCLRTLCWISEQRSAHYSQAIFRVFKTKVGSSHKAQKYFASCDCAVFDVLEDTPEMLPASDFGDLKEDMD